MEKKQLIDLNSVWKKRLILREESDKLRAEGERSREEGNKLREESDKLREESERSWEECVFAAYGNIKIGWKKQNDKWECHLETGEIFKP